MKKHFFFSSWRPTAVQDLLEVASPPNGTEKQSFKWNTPDLLVVAPPPKFSPKNVYIYIFETAKKLLEIL